MRSYENKTVVVTGGATGIGLALAKQFGLKGANIVIGEPRRERLDEAISILNSSNIEASGFEMDVTSSESVQALADFTWQRYGGAHTLINNAGIALDMQPMTNVPIDNLRRLFDVNFFGVWHGSAIFGKRMIDQGEPAAIYNVGSENSLFNAAPQIAAYIASKHAVRGLTEAMRDEFPDFIKVGLIVPGFVRSEIAPPDIAQFGMDTDDYAALVLDQIEAGQFYIVSHAYNVERFEPVHREISAAYAAYAPRYEGDEQFDFGHLMARLQAGDPSKDA